MNPLRGVVQAVAGRIRGLADKETRALAWRLNMAADGSRDSVLRAMGADSVIPARMDPFDSGARKPFNNASSGADFFLRNIYGRQYHHDYSTRAFAYIDSLASVPAGWHRIFAYFARGRPNGGIWLGDTDLLNLGHPDWPPGKEGGPQGAPNGVTWAHILGLYDSNSRAMLVGRGLGGSVDVAVHELGHAVDHALGEQGKDAVGWLSDGEAFKAVHSIVVPYLRSIDPAVADMYAEPQTGRKQLFAESFAWFHRTYGESFSGSFIAAEHLTDYYRALSSSLRI
ncbi:hypothetical protein [Nocardia iowensis]|uniref:Uncharacterized protein n=1 Tax=Nocardia iowensis TaxID=204891 RepID=A0ABX8RYC1_NOCIO|nr:hypothetical protein [Nocardia iowensis]QXN94660.1 hypothetical protein KV110_17360 [Nocardia iowensis]